MKANYRKRLRLQIQRMRGLFTAPWRTLPNFIIIGAHKCGTTTFYHYLRQHPMVYSAWKKDIKFFDLHYRRGVWWYRSYFPLKWHMKPDRHSSIHPITGDSATDYFYYPFAPKRIASLLSDVKLILLLRNPVDRAYAHYMHNRRIGWEERDFEEVINQDLDYLADISQFTFPEDMATLLRLRKFGYLEKGLYALFLAPWFDVFPQHRIFVIKSEAFFGKRKREIYRLVQSFLGLPGWENIDYRNINPGNYPPMNSVMRARLQKFYAPYNHMLYEMLGRNFDWA